MNMPDRIGPGLWPHPPIPLQQCVDAVVDYSRRKPLVPVLAASSETVYSSAEDAVRGYLRWELLPPGDLDGWKVIG
jgi:hypothetical protein